MILTAEVVGTQKEREREKKRENKKARTGSSPVSSGDDSRKSHQWQRQRQQRRATASWQRQQRLASWPQPFSSSFFFSPHEKLFFPSSVVGGKTQIATLNCVRFFSRFFFPKRRQILFSAHLQREREREKSTRRHRERDRERDNALHNPPGFVNHNTTRGKQKEREREKRKGESPLGKF